MRPKSELICRVSGFPSLTDRSPQVEEGIELGWGPELLRSAGPGKKWFQECQGGSTEVRNMARGACEC